MSQLGLLLMARALHAEAEPLLRRALAIDEVSYGLEHPDVARGLNNLAALLQDGNRLKEAEPLYRRACLILVEFEHRTGHQHPNRDAVLENYRILLAALGRSEAEITSAITAITSRPT
jgi:tetratricopeptide (TPR) repeat protein